MNVSIAKNGKVLNTSEILSTKEKCYQNARALLVHCFISLADHLWPGVMVQDDTVTPAKVWFVNAEKRSMHKGFDPEPKYQPGKNKKNI